MSVNNARMNLANAVVRALNNARPSDVQDLADALNAFNRANPAEARTLGRTVLGRTVTGFLAVGYDPEN